MTGSLSVPEHLAAPPPVGPPPRCCCAYSRCGRVRLPRPLTRRSGVTVTAPVTVAAATCVATRAAAADAPCGPRRIAAALFSFWARPGSLPSSLGRRVMTVREPAMLGGPLMGSCAGRRAQRQYDSADETVAPAQGLDTCVHAAGTAPRLTA